MKLAKYQREAAGEDHENDERLEVLVLDESVHGTAERPPGASNQCAVEPLGAAAGVPSAAVWTALVRVLDEHHLHLHQAVHTARTRGVHNTGIPMGHVSPMGIP